MDDDTLHLVRQLLTRIGTTMEDASVVALVWQDDLSLAARLEQVEHAARMILSLTAAAQALAASAG